VIRHAIHVVVAVVVVCSMAATPALAATPGAAENPRALAGSPGVAQTDGPTTNGCTFPLSRTDATGTEVTVDAPPERVVTVGGSASQTMWEIGAREKVVALDEFSLYLENATDDRTLLTYEGFTQRLSDSSIDSIVDADPDVVLAANIIADEDVQALRNRGVTVYKFRRATSIEFIYQKTRLTGKLVDACDGADARTAQLRNDVETIRRATAEVDRKRVFHSFFDTTAGRNTFVDEIIRVAGGENIGREYGDGFYLYRGSRADEVLTEEIRAENPEFITTSQDAVDSPFDTPTAGFEDTTALRRGQTVVLNPNHIYQPGPRVVDAMVALVKALHPAQYRKARLGLLDDGPDRGEWVVPYADADPLDSTVEDGTAYLRVKNGDPPRTRFSVPESFDQNASVRLTNVAVTTREPNPIFTVTVRNATATAPPLPGDATMLAAYATDTEDLHMFATDAAYTLSVPLESVPGEPSRLTVYRRTGDGWAPLETTVRINETSQTATVTASADRLTAFAVGVAGGDARGTAESTPEPMSAYAAPDSAPSADASAGAPGARSVEATEAPSAQSVEASGAQSVEVTEAPSAGTGVAPAVALSALAALLAATLLVGRRR